MNPTIYVACLASYNNGIRYGIEFDATLPPEDMMDIIKDMLENSPVEGAEEWEVQEFNDFGLLNTYRVGGLQHIHGIACFLIEHGDLGVELLNNFRCDVEYANRLMDEKYIGEYDSLEEYAIEYVNDCYDLPKFLMDNINLESIARILTYNLIKIELHGCVHLFHHI